MEQTYKIGEAATLLNLKTYVLRFWETEFSQITPVRTEKGQRLYTQKDIELLKRIRFLLHDRGLTIEGARRVLTEDASREGRGLSSYFSHTAALSHPEKETPAPVAADAPEEPEEPESASAPSRAASPQEHPHEAREQEIRLPGVPPATVIGAGTGFVSARPRSSAGDAASLPGHSETASAPPDETGAGAAPLSATAATEGLNNTPTAGTSEQQSAPRHSEGLPADNALDTAATQQILAGLEELASLLRGEHNDRRA